MVVLQLEMQFPSYFEKIVEQFEELNSVLRPLNEYADRLYREHPSVQDVLAAIYGDILDFCRTAEYVFVDGNGRKKSGLRTLLW